MGATKKLDKDAVIVSVRGKKWERAVLHEAAAARGLSLNQYVRFKLGLQVEARKERSTHTQGAGHE